MRRAARIGGTADSSNSNKRPLFRGLASFVAAAPPPAILILSIFFVLPIQMVCADALTENAVPQTPRAQTGITRTEITQTRIAELIAPKSAHIGYEEVFLGKGGTGKTFTAHSASKHNGSRVFEGDSSPFGPKAAYIPFWQLAELYRDAEQGFAYHASIGAGAEKGVQKLAQGVGRENEVLIGRGSIYLPSEYSPQERTVSRLVLEDLREKDAYPENSRLEIDLHSIPRGRIEGRPLDELSVKELGKNGRSVRYGIFFPSEEFPAAVLSVGISCYVPAYSVIQKIEEGSFLEPEDLRFKAVLREKAGRNLFDPKFTGGYRYEMMRHVKAGEILSSTHVRQIAPVGRGENVTCLFRRGSVRLEVKGRSLSEGGVGDIVRVRLSTGKIIESTVVDRAVVEAGG